MVLIESGFTTIVPQISSVDVAAMPFHRTRMSESCQELLTQDNFGTTRRVGWLQMLFLDVEREYGPDEVSSLVEEVAVKTGRKLRLGTPEEALLCKRQNTNTPEFFVVFGKSFNNYFIYWAQDRFLIDSVGRSSNWGPCHAIFLVNESASYLEQKLDEKKDYIVRFEQCGEEVTGRIYGFLPGGDYTVELLESAPSFGRGTVLSVTASNITSLEIMDSDIRKCTICGEEFNFNTSGLEGPNNIIVCGDKCAKKSALRRGSKYVIHGHSGGVEKTDIRPGDKIRRHLW
jgi:hypothetical protein